MSKPITIVAMMILKEREMIDFKDNVSKYLPEFKNLNVKILMVPYINVKILLVYFIYLLIVLDMVIMEIHNFLQVRLNITILRTLVKMLQVIQ